MSDDRSCFDFEDEAPRDRGASAPYLDRVRQALSDHCDRVLKQESGKGNGPKRYSTDYAVAWGRAQGWRLLDRERYDFRTKRHLDCPLGSDAMFSSPDGLVFVQGAGKGQRAEHRRRFEDRGGPAELARLKARFYYVEFVRGAKTPVLSEQWN